MGFRHSNKITSATTSLARRALLLFSILSMGVGNVWGAESEDIGGGSHAVNSSYFTISSTQFTGLSTTKEIRVYTIQTTVSSDIKIWQNTTSWSSVWGSSAEIPTTSEYYNSEGGYFAFPLTSGIVTELTTNGLLLEAKTAGISKVTIADPDVDEFLGSEASGATSESGSQEIAKETSAAQTIDLTGVSLTGVKYVRIYLADASGNALSDQSLLTVTYDSNAAVAAGSSAKNGVYVYNAGNNLDLSKVSITLDAGAGNFANYQIKCLLSTSTGTPTEGPALTKEPDWNLTYTYTFTYPVEEIEVPLSVGDLLSNHLELNYHTIAENKLKELSGSSSISSFFGRWYIRNKDTGVRQSLSFGSTAQASTWAIQMGYNNGYFDGNSNGCAINDNAGEYGSTSNDWSYAQLFGWFRVCLPTSIGTQMFEASDYEIVFECTDDYSGSSPVIKLRYIFQFPEIGEFEGEANTGATETSSTQTVADRAATSVAVDVTTQATDAKYARFFVTDAQGMVVNPTSILEVKYNDVAATACTTTNSGFYIYNGGDAFDVSKISVSLKASKLYKTYKVVALYSTALAKMTYAGGAMIEEPDYDNKHTYSFDYTITTYDQTPQVEWDATAMETDATDTKIDANWNTSLAELAAGQTIKWWVKDGSNNIQSLAIGTSRQDGTWTIGLPTGFTVASDVATLSGMTSVDAGQLESWVKTNVYAPSDKTYADVHDYKIVCEVYTNNAGTGNPNARYTFSIHKGFVGSLKSTATDATERVLLAASDVSKEISVTLPTGTKYLRAYLTNVDGNPVDPSGKLSITGGAAVSSSVEAYTVNYGSCLYNNGSALTSPATVTLTLDDTKLDEYKVVVVTSKDNAVVTSDYVSSEPDWDGKTTYWFKYPAKATTSLEENVEWSAQSMQIVAPDIEATVNLGTGYLEKNKKHYTLQWSVVDKDGNAQPLYQGSSRVNDYWSVAISGSPFTLSADSKVLTVTNDANLSTSTWTSWTSPVFYAPANKTMKQITDDGIVFVCKFYEDDNAAALNDALLSMTYTVYIDRTGKLGKLKDGGKRGGETIETITSGQTVATISLKDASDAFLSEMTTAPTYARIYLTKSDGTLIDPTTGEEQLTSISGATAFTTATYGYYLQNESGLTLPDATLTLPADKFNYYYVVVAMSKDTGETGHTGPFAREFSNRAASISSVYEPDYDYIYTIKFKETSTFPGTLTTPHFQHAKEILVSSEDVTELTIPLADNINKIKKELGTSTLVELANNFHVRWYLTKRDANGDYEKIPNSENYLTSVGGTYWKHMTEEDFGLYWNSATGNKPGGDYDAANMLNITVTKPSATDSWEEYRLMIVMSNDLTGQTDDGGDPKKLTHEPDNLNMLYIYNFYLEHEFQFVHDVGESGRPYVTKNGADIDTKDARINATVQQYSWDNSTGSKVAVSEDIRQGVHTVEYDIYVDPTTSTPVNLKLPFQNYFGSGNNLEPAAYIRWYDWTTDINHTRLIMDGSYLEDMQEVNNGSTVSRGFFMLNNSVGGIQPTQDLVGVKFNPNGLNELVTIACDVSKYYDGIYEGSVDDTRAGFSGKKHPYLMHEPTLSTRYIFNIRPASVIATSIQIGEDKLAAGGADMFQLAEDNGRVAVAMKDGNTTFSIRANLSELGYYYINNGASLLNCNNLQWYAYYEDGTGIYRNDTKLTTVDNDETKRISRIKVSALSGTYNHITSAASKSVTVAAGQRFHLVGYIGNGSVMAPVVHYEINLQDAPASAADELPLERTEAYLRQHMTLQATVDFDGLGGTELSSTLTTQSENHSTEPLPWNEAQYGFCYPDVRRIWANGGNDYMGISPLHGEYMLLRSMNGSGITSSGYEYHWWDGTELHDYTYSYGLGLDGRGAAGQYGSFLYVDASDESRTIAKMSFEANLCAGSELCFTGFIANMTGGTVQPQVMSTLYAVAPNGTRTRVVSFHSANLSTSVASTYTAGTWYQVYGRIAIPNNVDLSDVDHYEVDIDNYAPGTDGADYAVDQLQFYTSNAKLKVKQQDVNCGDESIKINIYIDAEAIQSKVGSNIYWRICDKDGNPISADKELYVDGNTTLTYGTTAVSTSGTIPTETVFNATTPNSGYFIGTDGNTYFSLASKGFNLEQGEQYYVSVYSLSEPSVSDEALWGKNTDACDIYSPIFVPKMMYLEMQDAENNVVTSVDGDCSTGAANVNLKVVLNMPDADEISGFKEYAAVPFDFFLGDKSTYTTYEKSSVLLSNALEDFRTSYPSATTIPTEYSTAKADNAAVIQQAVDAGLLFLDASPIFNHSISSANNTLLALPVVKVVNNGTTDFHICSPLEYVFTINTTGNGPTLTLGFEDVTGYPDAVRVVRVGLKQLKNMQDGSFILHIPVHNFKRNNSADDKNGTLTITGDLDLLKYQGGTDQTTDSKVSVDVDKVATFESTTINSSNMYIAVNFHGAGVRKPTFYEGFAYRMFFQVRDASDASACEGNVEFLLKVVPEFVTWQGGSAAWNSDANWKRSERAELYKGEVTDAATANNQATAGHPNGYKNNSEISVSTTPSTFVPMKFTYVTIPSDLRAPNLVNLAYDGTTNVYGNMETGATDNIQYDLMVRYTEETCQNHSVSGAVYDCEKFYGNWAKELYMKPNAELLNQQYLTYEKVWVEKELDANTWTLMSTPLQNTYAGDMYVPYNSTDANKNGRQISEAFQPITFSTTANAAGFTYSRTKYPVYQKGWTQQGVYVYTKTNDIRKTKYSANIPGGVSLVLDQWSHEYNDVTVPYSTWTAFAIRPHKKDQTEKTLIRLPKADTNYDYYQWDNTSPDDGKLSQPISKETTGKLLTDGTANISGVTYGTEYGSNARTASDGDFNALVTNVQSSPANYQLVGNPYLCSIDMAAFISGNSANLETAGYWTYTDNNTGTALTTGTVGPMQSFFVKVKTGATKVIFTPAMMVDGHTVTSAPAREFTLMATNERGASAATVSVGEETKSVETLFDSNLADVPVVYTVAEGRAVSINKVEELTKPIAFGVNCNSNDMVEVTFSDIERLTDGEVFVVDAVDGKTQQIYEGDTFTVQPNDYGRYFLTFGGVTSIETTLPTQDGTEGEKVIFDLQGRRVIYPGKGVYIVNGKKVVYK